MKSDFLPKVMHLDARSVSSDSDKAFLFNLFFESVYSKPLSNTLQDHDSAQQQATLDCINITDMDVLTALTNLDPSKARGIDGIGPRLLSTCALALYPVIHSIFNICLWYCQIPYEWKLHCIVPIFKSGDKSSIKNYRPISLLCYISKVLWEAHLWQSFFFYFWLYISFSVRFFERSLLPATATYVPA